MRSSEMNRQTGSLMVELVVALSILSIGLLAFLGSFMSNFNAVSDVQDLDEAHVAFENATELLSRHTFANIYDDYHNQTISVPELEAPGGGAASITVTCFLDENNIPAQCGPVTDLDGDDTTDTVVASNACDILPVRLSLTYVIPDGTITRDVYLVLDPD